MKKLTALALLIAMLLQLALFINISAEEEKITVIIETSPVSLFSSAGNEISKAAPGAEFIYTYDNAMTGYAVKINKSDLGRLSALSSVAEIYPSEEITLPEIHSTASTSFVGGGSIGNPSAYNGEGTAIAIIDSELDFNHEAFTLTNPEKALLKKSDISSVLSAGGLNISPEISANRIYRNSKVPFAYDYAEKDTDVWDEENIHGTHVAGIAAGNSHVIKGAAPESQIVFMKVFRTIAGAALGTTADLFAAVDDAVEFGVCAINLSMGVESAVAESSSYSKFQQIVTNIRNRGVLINCSAGNSGRGYQFEPIRTENIDYGITGIPSAFTDSTSVGSVDPLTFKAYTLRCGDIEIPLNPGESTKPFSSAFNSEGNEFFYAGYGTSVADYNGTAGKIALVEMKNPPGSTATSAQKIPLAASAGATGIIFISKVDSYFSLAESTIPTCIITASDGKLLKASEIKTVTCDGEMKIITKNEMTVSDYSAWNYSAHLNLSVDITAPGAMIYSSVPDDGYKSFSGTSMSAPQMTGASAIMHQYVSEKYPEYEGREKSDLIENLLMSSAVPLAEEGAYMLPSVQGAGLLDTDKAMSIDSILYGDKGKTKISLGDKLSDSFSLSFTKEDISGDGDGYDTLSLSVITDGYYTEDGINYIGTPRTLTSSFEVDEATDGNKKTYTVSVKLDPEETAENMKIFTNGFFIGGYVFLSASDGSEKEISIPFFGFYGDFSSAPIIDSAGSVFHARYPQAYILVDGVRRLAPLGYNMFNGKVSLSKAAISPNGDGMNDTIYIFPRFLRNVNYLYLMLMESEYVQMNGITKTAISKFTGSSYYTLPAVNSATGEIIEDGSYYIRISATLNYPGYKMHSENFPVYSDTAPPVIYGGRLTEEGYELEISDNHSIQGIVLTAADQAGNEIKKIHVPESYAAGEKYKTVFDIKDANPFTIKISAYDYGGNLAAYEEAKVKTRVSSSYSEGTHSLTATVTSEESGTADIYAAAYSGNTLEDIKIIKNASFPGIFDFSLKGTENSEIKVFIWNGMIPETR